MKEVTNEDDRLTSIPTMTDANNTGVDDVICRHGYLVVGPLSCPICDRIGGE